MADSAPAAVAIRDVEKVYGPVRVLNMPRLDLHRGQVVGLVGENGAGKSTLMGVLSGSVAADGGEVLVDGRRLPPGDTQAAGRLGVAMVSQEFPLVGQLSVAENLLLGRRPPGASGPVLDRARTHAHARRLLADVGVDIPVRRRVDRLSVAQRQMIEIAKAWGRSPLVLVLDEPTSALGPVESGHLLGLARRHARAGGLVVFVSHRLDEVREVCDRVLVLRNGELVDDLPGAEATDARLFRAMVGAELADDQPQTGTAAGAVAFEAERLTAEGLGPVSLSVRHGEVVGIAGLMGSGRSRLLHTVFGAQPVTGGAMRLARRPYAPRRPRDAVRAGVGLVPEDRKEQALQLDARIRENLTLAVLRRLVRLRLVLRPRDDVREARRLVDVAQVRCRSVEQRVRTLSGGNQQRVVFGRWLAADPRLLLLDEPTRGVDVGAKAEIYRLIGRSSSHGTAVLVASSEMEELMRMCHRIAVMAEGRIVSVLDRPEYSKELIMSLCAGAGEEAS